MLDETRPEFAFQDYVQSGGFSFFAGCAFSGRLLFLHVWNRHALDRTDVSTVYSSELHEVQLALRPSDYFGPRQNLYRPAVFFDGLGSHMLSAPLRNGDL